MTLWHRRGVMRPRPVERPSVTRACPLHGYLMISGQDSSRDPPSIPLLTRRENGMIWPSLRDLEVICVTLQPPRAHVCVRRAAGVTRRPALLVSFPSRLPSPLPLSSFLLPFSPSGRSSFHLSSLLPLTPLVSSPIHPSVSSPPRPRPSRLYRVVFKLRLSPSVCSCLLAQRPARWRSFLF